MILIEETACNALKALLLARLNDKLRALEVLAGDGIPLYSFTEGQIYFGERNLEQILAAETPVCLIIPDAWTAQDHENYELGDLVVYLQFAAMTKSTVNAQDEDESVLQKRLSRYAQAILELLTKQDAMDALALRTTGYIKSFKVMKYNYTPLQPRGDSYFKGLNVVLAWKTVP
jgi:hypothetical protein